MKTKLTLINNHEDWDVNRRYKVGASVRYNSTDWQNTTGVNSEPGTDDNWICTSDNRPYKVYTAIMNQTGTSAPIASILENTIGNIIWTYESMGQFKGTLANAFDLEKTLLPNPTEKTDLINGTTSIQLGSEGDADYVLIGTSQGGTVKNNLLQNYSLEIRVYR